VVFFDVSHAGGHSHNPEGLCYKSRCGACSAKLPTLKTRTTQSAAASSSFRPSAAWSTGPSACFSTSTTRCYWSAVLTCRTSTSSTCCAAAVRKARQSTAWGTWKRSSFRKSAELSGQQNRGDLFTEIAPVSRLDI